ncbi:MAG: hypothetical protein M1835_005217 [Candelina submexicana]|nr:MAG: hypothetical protein M1835_005217 [Candelina submexicana]
MTTTTTTTTQPFPFPPLYNFPPLFSPQPNTATRLAQLQRWSSLILSYCRHYRLWRLSLIDAIETPLFYNAALNRRLALDDARDVIDWMTRKEGGERAEWVGGDGTKSLVWVWWRKPEEWAGIIADWVEETGQKNTVLTLYELTEGDTVASQEFRNIDPTILQKSLNVLVKRGKAQVFGIEDQQGVKFF